MRVSVFQNKQLSRVVILKDYSLSYDEAMSYLKLNGLDVGIDDLMTFDISALVALPKDITCVWLVSGKTTKDMVAATLAQLVEIDKGRPDIKQMCSIDIVKVNFDDSSDSCLMCKSEYDYQFKGYYKSSILVLEHPRELMVRREIRVNKA